MVATKASVKRCPACKQSVVRHVMMLPKYDQCGDKRCLVTSCIPCGNSYRVLMHLPNVAEIKAWPIVHIKDIEMQLRPGWG